MYNYSQLYINYKIKIIKIKKALLHFLIKNKN